jgi:hypothetical protein
MAIGVDEQLVDLRAEPGHHYLPVAKSKMTDRLYTISNVIHISGVTNSLREKIIKEGFVEHYYHAPLKFLSIKTSPSGILEVYTELKAMGVKVQLEVIGPRHQPI